jgi:isopentenyl-diphosphate delta-isomerase
VHWSNRKTHADLIQAISLANSTEDELLIEVDDADNEVGRILKRDAHMTPDRSHRSMMILVFNTKGELILHQRSKNKSHSPLAWDFFGGHQQVGFSQEETAKAELYEELGIQTPVQFLMKRLHKTTTQSEYQYFYTTVSDGPYAYDRNEVEQISFFDPQGLVAGKYDAQFRILPHVKEVTEFYLKH